MAPEKLRATCALLTALISSVTATTANTSRTEDLYPRKYEFGTTSSNYTGISNSTCITLTESNPSVTLDYGTEIGGFPFINVSALPAAGVQVEIKYSEAKSSLDSPFADGPWTYSNGLSNTFRTETFNVTNTGRLQSFFIQGGLRWQSIQLLGKGSVTLCGAGVSTSNDIRPVDSLPGYFESSNDIYNQIWALGVRSVQQACIANGSAPSTWEVTDDGVFIRGQSPAQSVLGADFSNYTMSFSTKIVRGGTGWRVAAGLRGYGQYFVLTSEYPASTFLNTNRTLLPPNTLVTGFGWSIVNQTSLQTGPVIQYPVPFDVKEDQWYRISTTINATGYTISINGSSPVFVSNANSLTSWSSTIGSTGDKTAGTWGFGPFQDQAALVKNVAITTQNGTILYQNAMTDDSILEEYGIMGNRHSVCLDGAKRDRLVWSGDFVHTQRIISASTNRTDFLTGTLAYLLHWQAQSGAYAGFAGMAPAMGQSPKYAELYNTYALIDYQFLFLLSFASYYTDSGDMDFLEKHWEQLKTLVEALLPLVDDNSGLITTGSLPGSFYLGDSNGTTPSASFVYALNKMASLATAKGEDSTAANWTATADGVADAINSQLWNAELGTYAISLNSSGNSSLAGTAFAILAGAANQTQTASAIAALSDLRLGPGYKDDTTVTTGAADTALSPNVNGFLLEVLLVASEKAATAAATETNNTAADSTATAAAISVLLDQLWPAMLTTDEYATGSAWEYVSGDGRPGLGAYTSHAHPWAGAPTYLLTEHVLGVRATAPGFARWELVPSAAVTRNVRVDWARGRVPVPGGEISAGWEIRRDGRTVAIEVCGAPGTSGVVRLPTGKASRCVVDGQEEEEQGREGCRKGRAVELKVEGARCRSVVVDLA